MCFYLPTEAFSTDVGQLGVFRTFSELAGLVPLAHLPYVNHNVRRSPCGHTTHIHGRLFLL